MCGLVKVYSSESVLVPVHVLKEARQRECFQFSRACFVLAVVSGEGAQRALVQFEERVVMEGILGPYPEYSVTSFIRNSPPPPRTSIGP